MAGTVIVRVRYLKISRGDGSFEAAQGLFAGVALGALSLT